eukprot:scaffold726_cov262-Pinguiococcus_pyrenoidosus.AAC.21
MVGLYDYAACRAIWREAGVPYLRWKDDLALRVGNEHQSEPPVSVGKGTRSVHADPLERPSTSASPRTLQMRSAARTYLCRLVSGHNGARHGGRRRFAYRQARAIHRNEALPDTMGWVSARKTPRLLAATKHIASHLRNDVSHEIVRSGNLEPEGVSFLPGFHDDSAVVHVSYREGSGDAAAGADLPYAYVALALFLCDPTLYEVAGIAAFRRQRPLHVDGLGALQAAQIGESQCLGGQAKGHGVLSLVDGRGSETDAVDGDAAAEFRPVHRNGTEDFQLVAYVLAPVSGASMSTMAQSGALVTPLTLASTPIPEQHLIALPKRCYPAHVLHDAAEHVLNSRCAPTSLGRERRTGPEAMHHAAAPAEAQ